MSDKRYTKAKRKQVIEDWRKTGDPPAVALGSAVRFFGCSRFPLS